MPRTIAVDSPGCPPVRALTTDVLGLVKVVEARGKAGTPKVVETWGPPDASRSAIAASYADRKNNPLLAVARSNGSVELLNPLNGDSLATVKVNESCSSGLGSSDAVAGLHLLGTKNIEFSSKSVTFLTCTSNGKACLRSILTGDASSDSTDTSPSTWDVCNSGKVTCSSVDASENYALFAGKNIEINVWDLEKRSKIWTAKSPPRNSIGIFSPTWFTAATFLDKDDHRKIAAGTNNYQLRLYDISAQRRPVISVTFRESPIKVVTEDPDGYRIYIGTGSGDLASFDMRTGKLLGCFVGKCSGGIRSIVRHPELPLIASCGLDRYLRFWDTETRKPLSAVFLKQHLTSVVIDSHFSAKESPVVSACQANDPQEAEDGEVDDADEFLPGSMSKKKERSKSKTKKRKNKGQEDDLVDEGLPSSSVESELNIEKKKLPESRDWQMRKSKEEFLSRKAKKASPL